MSDNAAFMPRDGVSSASRPPKARFFSRLMVAGVALSLLSSSCRKPAHEVNPDALAIRQQFPQTRRSFSELSKLDSIAMSNHDLESLKAMKKGTHFPRDPMADRAITHIRAIGAEFASMLAKDPAEAARAYREFLPEIKSFNSKLMEDALFTHPVQLLNHVLSAAKTGGILDEDVRLGCLFILMPAFPAMKSLINTADASSIIDDSICQGLQLSVFIMEFADSDKRYISLYQTLSLWADGSKDPFSVQTLGELFGSLKGDLKLGR